MSMRQYVPDSSCPHSCIQFCCSHSPYQVERSVCYHLKAGCRMTRRTSRWPYGVNLEVLKSTVVLENSSPKKMLLSPRWKDFSIFFAMTLGIARSCRSMGRVTPKQLSLCMWQHQRRSPQKRNCVPVVAPDGLLEMREACSHP